MILIYGNEGCSKCSEVKNFLDVSGVIFEYKYLSLIPVTEKFEVMQAARKSRQLNLPIIFIDKKLVSFEDLVKKLNDGGIICE